MKYSSYVKVNRPECNKRKTNYIFIILINVQCKMSETKCFSLGFVDMYFNCYCYIFLD